MATITAIRDRVRLELGDQAQPFQTSAPADGVTTRFEIPFKPLQSGPTVYSIDSGGIVTVFTENVDYTIDYANGFMLFSVAPASGGTMLITGQHYRYFQDSDVDQFINTALLQQVHGRTTPTGGPLSLTNLPPVEEYPLAIGAVIEALWSLYTDSAFDIDILSPDGVTIPRHQRNQQLLEAISNRRAQYQELSQLLGIGLYAVEIFQARRVSLATGRLVPFWINREVEDNRYPRRVFLPQNTYGAPPEISTFSGQSIDLHAIANNPFTYSLTGLGNLTGLTVHAAVRPYDEAISKLAQFTVTITDITTGAVTITLNSQQTFSLRRTAFWDLETQDTAGNITTLVKGGFSTERQGGF